MHELIGLGPPRKDGGQNAPTAQHREKHPEFDGVAGRFGVGSNPFQQADSEKATAIIADFPSRRMTDRLEIVKIEFRSVSHLSRI